MSLEQVLYLKNLGPRVMMKDLVSLFARFQKEDSPPIQFRLLSGRMRGQAFLTFPGESLPCALQFLPDPGRCHIFLQATGLVLSLLSKKEVASPRFFSSIGRGFIRRDAVCSCAIFTLGCHSGWRIPVLHCIMVQPEGL